MAEPFTLDWSTNEVVRYFVLPTRTTEERFVTGADVMPGAAAIVRDVAIYIDATGTARALDAEDDGPGFGEAEDRDFPTTAPLALWSPGRPSVRQDGAARNLPAGADIVARVHYKKTWITEGEEFADQSRIGLYVGDESDRAVESMLLSSPERAGRTDADLQSESGCRRQRACRPAGGRHRSQGRAGRGRDARRDTGADALPARAGHRVADPLLVRRADRPAGRVDDRGQRDSPSGSGPHAGTLPVRRGPVGTDQTGGRLRCWRRPGR